jgi:hypothetical protein
MLKTGQVLIFKSVLPGDEANAGGGSSTDQPQPGYWWLHKCICIKRKYIEVFGIYIIEQLRWLIQELI